MAESAGSPDARPRSPLERFSAEAAARASAVVACASSTAGSFQFLQPKATSPVAIRDGPAGSDIPGLGAPPRRMTATTLAEEHTQELRRASRAYTPSPTTLGEDHALLIRRLESGIEQRDTLLKQERDRHRAEMATLSKRLADAEERESSMHSELLMAKQDQVALTAAQRRLTELTRSSEAATAKLSSLSDAESLNHQKHTLLAEHLDAERQKTHALNLQLDALRVQLDALRVQLAQANAESAGFSQESALRAEQLKSEGVQKVARVLLRNDRLWGFRRWRTHHEQVHWMASMAKRFGKDHRAMLSVIRSWRDLMLRTKQLTRLRRVAGILKNGDIYFAWEHWAQLSALAVREHLRRQGASPWLKVHANGLDQELQEIVASCHAQNLALEESLQAIISLETMRRSDCARLEAEVASLSESLQAKRESCEKLRRSNARIIAQFETAEAEFLDADRRRRDAASGSVVGRVIEAVFGLEPPPHPENVRTLVETRREGHPLDRMEIVAHSSGSKSRPKTKAAARPSASRPRAKAPPTVGSRRPHSFPQELRHEPQQELEWERLSRGRDRDRGRRDDDRFNNSSDSRTSPHRSGSPTRRDSPRSSAAATDLVERARARAERELAELKFKSLEHRVVSPPHVDHVHESLRPTRSPSKYYTS